MPPGAYPRAVRAGGEALAAPGGRARPAGLLTAAGRARSVHRGGPRQRAASTRRASMASTIESARRSSGPHGRCTAPRGRVSSVRQSTISSSLAVSAADVARRHEHPGAVVRSGPRGSRRWWWRSPVAGGHGLDDRPSGRGRRRPTGPRPHRRRAAGSSRRSAIGQPVDGHGATASKHLLGPRLVGLAPPTTRRSTGLLAVVETGHGLDEHVDALVRSHPAEEHHHGVVLGAGRARGRRPRCVRRAPPTG